MDTIQKIVDHLSGRLIPEEMQLDGAAPPGYEEKLQNSYRSLMRKRAYRVLQTITPSDRRSILRFLENEEDIRDAKSLLDDLGYNEQSIRQMNGMGRHLVESKDHIVNQAHTGLLEEHELMSVFVGGASEAQVSLDNN